MPPPPPGRERSPFHTFETLRGQIEEDPGTFWEEVQQLHSLVTGWYGDRDFAHLIGYLVAQGATLTDIVRLAHDRTKTEFRSALTRQVRHVLALTESGVRDLRYTDRATTRALLLMNVETVRRRAHSTERYSFREHASGRWTQEHIHAQSAQPLTQAVQWREWLRLHRDVIKALPDIDGGRSELLTRLDDALGAQSLTANDFGRLEHEVLEYLSASAQAEGDADDIGNLALLDGRDNSALSNSTFAVKRSIVLKKDLAGSYVPVCTRNAFLKYYTPGEQHQVHFWGPADRRHYVDEMVSVLAPYLRAEASA